VPFELFIAGRYLLARRRQAFISVISLISTLGVTVGVMALIIALALMTGLQRELRDRILGSTAHIYVFKAGGITDYEADVARITGVPGVLGAAPSTTEMGLVWSLKSEASAQITVKGIDPALEPGVTEIAGAMKSGSLDALAELRNPPGVVLGTNLATQLGVALGDEVDVLTAHSTRLTPGGVTVRPRRARVVGTFSLGLYEFDHAYAFVSLDLGQRLSGVEAPQQIQVKVAAIDDAPEIAEQLTAMLGPGYTAQDWQQVNKPLFAALWLEKVGLSIAIGLIVAVAALNIIASLVLLVMEKSRDIAILKTMGLSSDRVMRIFMLQGLIIGLVGTVVGGAGGVIVSSILDKYQLIRISMDVYQVAHVPFVIRPFDLIVVLLSAIVVCFVATIYPSRQAARLDPVQALRFE
jgi:lipoprotein-releasing system permease protein